MSNEMVVPETGEIVEEVDSGLVFGTKDPDLIIEKATKIANRLVEIVEKAKLYAMIKDKKYVKAEGWTTMAAMLGVFPRVVAVERLEREEGFAYSAKVDLRTLSDALVGSGEAICSSVERFGVGKDEYAVKSMAQTRALGKACRISFSWIMALAGFEPTPAEEMIGDGGTFRSVAMPRAKETSREATVVQSEAEKARIVLAKEEGLRPVRSSELPLPAAQSKFFVRLHARAREKKVDPVKMQQVIAQLFQKDSSKDLVDSECVILIQMIESGKLS